MYQKGYIEKGLKPVYWCPHCETALAEAEVEYADHTSTAIYVKFEFVEKDAEKIKELAGIQTDYPIYALIWTTTPWTIPSNLAISLNARYEYSLVQYADDIYVIATDLVDAFVKDNQFEPEDVKILGSVKGRDIENFNTMHPLYDRKSPDYPRRPRYIRRRYRLCSHSTRPWS